VILEMCTTYKGVPFGPAVINYKDPEKKRYSFKGVGILNEGKLHNSPFVCQKGNGIKHLY
jgi:hypothetical protein